MPHGPKLVCVDLESDEMIQTIAFPAEVALEMTYLNDIRFDLRRGKAGVAFITDSSLAGPNGLIVVDLASGRSWRKLTDHPSTRAVDGFVAIIEGRPLAGITIGADGIAISADGERLYFCPLASRRLYSVSVEALADEDAGDEAVAATLADHVRWRRVRRRRADLRSPGRHRSARAALRAHAHAHRGRTGATTS
jgi:sugar lactone lactonase YvrE